MWTRDPPGFRVNGHNIKLGHKWICIFLVLSRVLHLINYREKPTGSQTFGYFSSKSHSSKRVKPDTGVRLILGFANTLANTGPLMEIWYPACRCPFPLIWWRSGYRFTASGAAASEKSWNKNGFGICTDLKVWCSVKRFWWSDRCFSTERTTGEEMERTGVGIWNSSSGSCHTDCFGILVKCHRGSGNKWEVQWAPSSSF